MSISGHINKILKLVFEEDHKGLLHIRARCHRNLSIEEAERIRSELESLRDMRDVSQEDSDKYIRTTRQYRQKLIDQFDYTKSAPTC